MSGIYLHIPFCKQACSYCDFYFVTRHSMRASYVERLMDEITQYKDTAYTEEPVETIYFGGGTPSLLEPAQIEAILAALDDTFTLQPKEITLEMNPDDVTADYLSGLKHAGITRASMGVQTFQPELLKSMNRAHSRREALQCLELLSSSEFEAFTVDLIYGNPGQTLQQLSDDLELVLAFKPPHLSAYSLTVEPATRLGKQVSLGRILPPEDDAVAKQFELLNERLDAANIQRYEVSNYSKKDAEAVHNSNYWEHKNYLGLGPAAHSFWWDEHPRRWSNHADLKAWLIGKNHPKESEQLNLLQLAEERLMMGLRTRQGVSSKELRTNYAYILSEDQEAYLQKKEQEGRLWQNDSISLTNAGILIADAIILDLITLH